MTEQKKINKLVKKGRKFKEKSLRSKWFEIVVIPKSLKPPRFDNV